MKIEWNCKKCGSKFNLDKSLKLECTVSDEEIIKASKEYSRLNKLYLQDEWLRTKKRTEFKTLIAENNNKFWCKKWELREDSLHMYVRIEPDSWWKKGKEYKTITEFVYSCPKPEDSKHIPYGIVCPMCKSMLTIHNESIKLSGRD